MGASENVSSMVMLRVILSVLTSPLQIAMIVIGDKYKDECPVENMIPIYLIVGGSAGLLSTFCACAVEYREARSPSQSVSPYWHVIKHLSRLVLLPLFAWFIAGNVWIYKNYEPNYTDPKRPYFCHKTLYLFAFWVITSYYILFGVLLVIWCVGNLVGLVFFIICCRSLLREDD